MKYRAHLGAAGAVVLALAACAAKDSDSQAEGTSATSGAETSASTTTFDPSATSVGDSATTSATTPTTGATSSATGDGFIMPPDGGVEGMCDPKQQDCPDGEKCTAYGSVEGSPWNANKCVPVSGMDQVGDPCNIEGGKYTGEDNCDVGLICLLTDDDGNGGVCVEFCDTNDNCPQSGGQCATFNDGSLPICLVNCDPLIQDCPDGQGCYQSTPTNSFVCFKHSGESGEGAPGDECNYLNQCQPGTACLAPESVEGCGAQAGCCSLFCDLSDPNPSMSCNPNEDCVLFLDNPPPQYMDVGICALPG